MTSGARTTPLTRLLWIGGVGVILVVVGVPWPIGVLVLAGLALTHAREHEARMTDTDEGWMVPRVTAYAMATAGFAVALFLTARTTGAGWLIVMSCAIIGVLVVGTVLPALMLIGVRPVVRGPHDAVAGESFDVSIRMTRPRLGVFVGFLAPVSPPTAVVDDWVTVPVQTERGVIPAIFVIVASSAPFEMTVASRRLWVTLEHPVHVAPRTGGRVHDDTASADAVADGVTGAQAAHGDHLRSVREHVSGDALRLVHWPVTARRGTLVVKELEAPATPDLHLVVALTGDPDADDAVCEDAMATILAALDDDRRVILHTNDGTSARTDHVRDRRDAGRTLAAASPGPIAEPTDVEGVVLRLPRPGVA